MPLILVLLPLCVGCATAEYRAPEPPKDLANFTRTVNRSFDETWDALIEYCGGTYFGIDEFEKESGLLTLSFGATKPSHFVTGGHIDMVDYYMWGVRGEFKGDYVDFLDQYLDGDLTAKMNIVVKGTAPNKTRVTVNTHYYFAADAMDDINPFRGDRRGRREEWSFHTKDSATVNIHNPIRGAPPTRTICSTYNAEKEILKAVESLN
jgi:hypothetical protein